MAKMQGLIKAYGGLGCPKGKNMDCASLKPIRRMIGLREGQDGVNKGGSRLINAYKFFVRVI